MDINKKLFKRLKDYFKDSVKLSFIASHNVLFVTNDDKEVCFFAIGFWVNWQPGNFDTK
jgi:hypothetical protein